MRKLLILFFIAPLFVVSSCDKEPEIEIVGNVEVNLKANYDGEQFMTQQEYVYTSAINVKFTEFNLYVSNISLLEFENSTEETELAEVDFVNLSFTTDQATEAAAGYDLSTKKVPSGTYRAVKIGFGLPADINRTSPGDYGNGNALATSTHYWASANSYVFSKIEGFSDNNGNGIFEASEDEGIRVHLGQDEVYTERILFPSEPIVVEEDGTVNLSLNIDVKKLFEISDITYDANQDGLLDIENYSSSREDTDDPGFLVDRTIMSNYSSATKLNQ